MKWSGHVALGGEERCIQGFSGGNPEGKNHLRDPGVNGKIILTLTLLTWRIG